MTLDQLFQDDISASDLYDLWLVFDVDIANRLKDIQPFHQHQIMPIELIDGSFAVCADLLTEKDGIYAPTFAALDQSAFPLVQVISQAAISELFPTSNADEA